MGTDVGNIKEDLTAVGNVQGLETDPIGLKSEKPGKYKKNNQKTTLKKLKDALTIK